MARSPNHNLIIPIREMQYLAIWDAEELFFRPGAQMLGDITWQDFQAHDRTALDAAVAYEAVYYTQETPINTALTACAAARVADFEGNHNFLVSRA